MSDFGTPTELASACEGDLHPMARKGLDLFNTQRYWHAHEALEEAWLKESGPVRHLYRGVLQAGVVYLHAQRGNYRGVIKVYKRCRRWLDPFPPHCRGINVRGLRTDLEAVYEETKRRGPNGMNNFNTALLKPIQWVDQRIGD